MALLLLHCCLLGSELAVSRSLAACAYVASTCIQHEFAAVIMSAAAAAVNHPLLRHRLLRVLASASACLGSLLLSCLLVGTRSHGFLVASVQAARLTYGDG